MPRLPVARATAEKARKGNASAKRAMPGLAVGRSSDGVAHYGAPGMVSSGSDAGSDDWLTNQLDQLVQPKAPAKSAWRPSNKIVGQRVSLNGTSTAVADEDSETASLLGSRSEEVVRGRVISDAPGPQRQSAAGDLHASLPQAEREAAQLRVAAAESARRVQVLERELERRGIPLPQSGDSALRALLVREGPLEAVRSCGRHLAALACQERAGELGGKGGVLWVRGTPASAVALARTLTALAAEGCAEAAWLADVLAALTRDVSVCETSEDVRGSCFWLAWSSSLLGLVQTWSDSKADRTCTRASADGHTHAGHVFRRLSGGVRCSLGSGPAPAPAAVARQFAERCLAAACRTVAQAASGRGLADGSGQSADAVLASTRQHLTSLRVAHTLAEYLLSHVAKLVGTPSLRGTDPKRPLIAQVELPSPAFDAPSLALPDDSLPLPGFAEQCLPRPLFDFLCPSLPGSTEGSGGLAAGGKDKDKDA